MDRNYFIILVYGLVCEPYQAIIARHSLHQRGFAPALSDEEVITMEICGEYFGFSQEEAIYAYFRSHYPSFFPKLTERTPSSPLIPGRYRCGAIPEVSATAVSNPRPTIAIARPRTCPIMASNWDYASPAAA